MTLDYLVMLLLIYDKHMVSYALFLENIAAISDG